MLAVTATPYVVVALHPPPGKAFIGTFYYGDDFYNYLSYAEQAQRGAWLFQNKVLLEPHRPALVNLEWWLVGRLGALLGENLLLAYRVFAALVAAAFLWVTDLWLRRLGLGPAWRLPGLLLVAGGGGLGGLLYSLTSLPLFRCLDVYAGLFPFLGLLTNAHFTAGTTLLLLSLYLLDREPGRGSVFLGVLAASATALVRPYDFVLLVLIHGTAAVWLFGPRRSVARLLPLLGLLPVVGYLYWLFYRNPAFSFYAQSPYPFPARLDFLPALGPALALAVLGMRIPPEAEAQGRARVHLVAWALLGLVVILVQPVPFSFQFLVGIGFPLLALGALAISRWTPRAALAASVLFGTSLLVTLHYVLRPQPVWFTARQNMELVRMVAPRCQPGDVLFAPPEVGVLAYGLTGCRAFVSHKVDPRYDEHMAEMRRFNERTPAERAALLDAHRVSHLLLPGEPVLVPAGWLGPDTPFRRVAEVKGTPSWGLYLRLPSPE